MGRVGPYTEKPLGFQSARKFILNVIAFAQRNPSNILNKRPPSTEKKRKKKKGISKRERWVGPSTKKQLGFHNARMGKAPCETKLFKKQKNKQAF